MSTKNTNKNRTKGSNQTDSGDANASLLITPSKSKSNEHGPSGNKEGMIAIDPFAPFHPLSMTSKITTGFGEKGLIKDLSMPITWSCALTSRVLAKAVREKKDLIIALPSPEFLDVLFHKTTITVITWLTLDKGESNSYSGHTFRPRKFSDKLPEDQLQMFEVVNLKSQTKAEIMRYCVDVALSYVSLLKSTFEKIPSSRNVYCLQYGLTDDSEVIVSDPIRDKEQIFKSIITDLEAVLKITADELYTLIIRQVSQNSAQREKIAKAAAEAANGLRRGNRNQRRSLKKKGGPNVS